MREIAARKRHARRVSMLAKKYYGTEGFAKCEAMHIKTAPQQTSNSVKHDKNCHLSAASSRRSTEANSDPSLRY